MFRLGNIGFREGFGLLGWRSRAERLVVKSRECHPRRANLTHLTNQGSHLCL